MSDDCPTSFLNPNTHHEYDMVLVNMSDFSIFLGIAVTLGSLISFVPQVMKIYKKRSILGINFFWVFFYTSQQFCRASNTVILNLPRFLACSQVGFKKCFPSLIVSIQMVGLYVMFFGVPLLYILFSNDYEGSNSTLDIKKRRKNQRIIKVLYILIMCYTISVVGISCFSISFQGICSNIARNLARVLGYFSGFFVLFQWLPQIYSTYKFKGSGSISIITLAIQAPGGIINLIFMIFISKEQFSTWISIFINTSQTLILLCMLLYYNFKSKFKKILEKKKKVNDHTPLLSPEYTVQ
ncbi:pq loop repeat protein [Anaeramoeba flamelloides]|uniref:Pq loop repeat protein n=1 Tax=Anaeramoeba flamelloides TaxID=1746091 RepID=A0ABQ8Y764_9EUKA|nr:pq loop repeat protein [Anaeramoeba flamelloides]